MSLQAQFLYGNPIMVPYTPSGAVSAGDVIVSGAMCFIAHEDIAANALGAVAAGGGVYQIAKTSASGNDFSMGEKAYWNDSSNVGDDTATSTTALGFFEAAAAEGDTTARVIHWPF